MLCTFAISAVGSLKLGARPNYYDGFLHLSFIALAWYLQSLFEGSSRLSADSARILTTALALAICFTLPYNAIDAYRQLNSLPRYSALKEIAEDLRVRMQNEGKGVYVCIDPGYDDPTSNFLLGRAIMPMSYLPPQIAANSSISFAKFQELANSGAIRYLAIPESRNPGVYMNVDFGSYQEVAHVGKYRIYSPENR